MSQETARAIAPTACYTCKFGCLGSIQRYALSDILAITYATIAFSLREIHSRESMSKEHMGEKRTLGCLTPNYRISCLILLVMRDFSVSN